MDPKEKAKELIEKFEKMHFFAGGIGINKKQAIECAKISVDEIIHSESVLVEDLLFEQSKNIAQSGVQYWIEVKEEIEEVASCRKIACYLYFISC